MTRIKPKNPAEIPQDLTIDRLGLDCLTADGIWDLTRFKPMPINYAGVGGQVSGLQNLESGARFH